MADEQKTENTAPAGAETEQQKQLSQDEVNRIVAERLARERSKYGDYDEVKQRLQTFEAQEKERKEAELRAKGEYEKLEADYKSRIADLEPYKQKYEDWEKAESERVDKAMEGMSDSQKEIVSSLPLTKRLTAINEFKASIETQRPGITAVKGGKLQGEITIEAVEEMKAQYGQGSPQWKEAYAKYRKGKGYT